MVEEGVRGPNKPPPLSNSTRAASCQVSVSSPSRGEECSLELNALGKAAIDNEMRTGGVA
ncbi:MAG: hypothetical protein Pars92KO_01730 [Parasphingorhabdus sp.]